jgi:alanyl-tRNA synthetase
VRVVQIGGGAGELNGYSMELCGGTHTRGTGEIGYFRIASENAIAAGVRRIEAVAGLAAYDKARSDLELLASVAGKLNVPIAEIDKKLEALLIHQKELEKQIKTFEQKQAAATARSLIDSAVKDGPLPVIIKNLGDADGDYLQSIGEALKGMFKGVAVLAAARGDTVSLVAVVAPELTKAVQAGKIIQTIAPIVGGKGGGRPELARGGGKDHGKIAECLAKANELLNAIRL